MKESVIERIIALVFGHKYYVNIINTRGTDRIEMSSYIHHSPEEAEAHKRSILTTRLYDFVETVTFRSRKPY